MPKDLWITMLTTIIAAVIAHQLNQSTLVEAISQKMGKLIRILIRAIARFGISILIIIFCLWRLIHFVKMDGAAERWEILAAIYFAFLGLEFVKFVLADVVDVKTGRRPL